MHRTSSRFALALMTFVVALPLLADDAGGLILSFSPADMRVARLVSLYVPEGTPPSVFQPTGAFRATWEGSLNLDAAGDYTFTADGRGALRLLINNESALDAGGDDFSKTAGKPIPLHKGVNHIVARYESPASGDAFVRLYWQSKEFPREPMPPTRFTHDVKAEGLAASLTLREGRELFATRRCFKCHDPSDALRSMLHASRSGAMPELAMDAPSLNDAGARFQTEWMARWIANPRSLRPQALMPATLLDAGHARDIAAYLATLGAPDEKPEVPPSKETLTAGAQLFANLRCIACHAMPQDTDPRADIERMSLRFVSVKWKPAALRQFLLHPNKHYTWVRMPDLKLTADEAAKLVAFLFAQPEQNLEPPAGLPASDVNRGRELVASSGCLNCHTLANQQTTLLTPSLAVTLKTGWNCGCLASDATARGNAPGFSLTAEQRQALQAFAATDWSSLAREAMPEFAERQVKALNCIGCHSRDGQTDLWARYSKEAAPWLTEPLLKRAKERGEEVNLGVELNMQLLTWAGGKLKPEWMERLLSGTLPYKPREWLLARMPAFPARAAGLARGLAEEHGFAPVTPPEPAPDAEMAKVGQKLVSPDSIFNCVQCHAVAGQKAVPIFESPGVDFAIVSERLHKEYFYRWLMRPARLDPTAKMPQFADDKGESPIDEFYKADALKQYEAIWQYFVQLGASR